MVLAVALDVPVTWLRRVTRLNRPVALVIVLGLLAAAVLLLGVWPAPLLEVMQESVRHLVEQATASKLP